MENEDSVAGAEGGEADDGSRKPVGSNSNHSTAEDESHDEPLHAASPLSLASRKFLRNAPRPERWESYGDAVLNHLGRKDAYGVLSQTVAKVRAINGISPKAGPGRKSNAVHALLFYKYLLDRARQFSEGKPDTGDGEDHDDGNGNDDGSNVDDDGMGLHDEPFATNQVYDDPLAAFTDEEFIAHHKTVCEVCEDPSSKELLLCSTCRLVFHVTCSRPVLDDGLPPPEGEIWRCSYCVLATEPKHTKPRRIAAAAVRLMARIRNQHKRGRGVGVPSLEGGLGANDSSTGGIAAADAKTQCILRRGKPKARSSRASAPKQTGNSAHTETAEPSKVESGDGGESTLDLLPPATAATHVDSGMGRRSSRRLSAAATEAKPGIATKPILASVHSKPSDDESGDKEPGTPTSSGSPTRLSLEIQRLNGPFSPGSVGEGGEPLGKRVRKQPTLYNPQDGPARQWKSDEILPQSRRSSTSSSSGSSGDGHGSHDDDDDDGGTSAAESGQGDNENVPGSISRGLRRGQGGDVWCNFCFDDPGIKVCCFCACRVCFGKKSRTKLLICDMCNDEYHTYCLMPPLQSVPTEDKWYCPTCADANERRDARTSSRLRFPAAASETTDADFLSPRRTSNRKISPPKKDGEIVSVASSERGSASGSRRPRGRPRKYPLPDEATVTKGKKRGRPPGSTRGLSTEPPRKRGRPPKSKPVPPPSPGRALSKSPSNADLSEKAPIACDAEADLSESPQSNKGSLSSLLSDAMQIPVTVSRSGRTVKRSSFHDEVDQGDQHLRTGRLGSEQQRKISTGEQNSETSPMAMEESMSIPYVGDSVDALTRVDLGVSDDIAPATAASVEADECAPAQALAVRAESSPAFAVQSTDLLIVDATSAPEILQTHSGSAEDGETSLLDQDGMSRDSRTPRRKPGARECMQLSRRFGAQVIADAHVEVLMDYCKRGKCEHLIRMRERLDEHSRFLESQLAGLEVLVLEQNSRSQAEGS